MFLTKYKTHALLSSLMMAAYVSLSAFTLDETIKLIATTIAGKVEMKIPESFLLTSGGASGVVLGVSIKKPEVNNLAAFQDKRYKAAEFNVSATNTPWSDKDVPMLRSFYRANIKALHSKVNFTKDELSKINKREFAVFEFVSEVYADSTEFYRIKTPAKATSMKDVSKGKPVQQSGMREVKNLPPPIKKYTYIQYTVANQKVYVFNFTCNERDRLVWQKTIAQMMRTIKL